MKSINILKLFNFNQWMLFLPNVSTSLFPISIGIDFQDGIFLLFILSMMI